MLGEQVVEVQPAGQQGQREQQPAGPEEAEQQTLHGLQRREAADQSGRVLVLELAILHEQQQRLEHGDGQQAVGENRQQDVGEDPRVLTNSLGSAGRDELSEEYGQAAERKEQEQQDGHRDAQRGQQDQGDHRGGDQAGGIEEVEVQPARGDQLAEQAGDMGQQGEQAERQQDALVRRLARDQAQGLVAGGGRIERGGDDTGQQRLHRSFGARPERR